MMQRPLPRNASICCITFLAIALSSNLARGGSNWTWIASCPKSKPHAYVIHGPNDIVTWVLNRTTEVCEFSVNGFTRYGKNIYFKQITVYASAMAELRNAYRRYGDARKAQDYSRAVKSIESYMLLVFASPGMDQKGSIDPQLDFAVKSNRPFLIDCVRDFYAGVFGNDSRVAKTKQAHCSVEKDRPHYMAASVTYETKTSTTFFPR